MVPRATPYPPLSQIRPNKNRKTEVVAAATMDGDSVTGEDDDDDDTPLDLSSKSRSPPPPLQPPKHPLPPPLTVGPASIGIPIQQQQVVAAAPVPSAANIAAAALSAANLDPAIREEVYKAACAMAMQPIILPQVRPAVTPQAVAAAAAALTGGLALPFPGLIQANASPNAVEGLEAEIKRRVQLQQQQQQSQQAQAAAALAAMGMLKGPPRLSLPLQQPPQPPPPPPPLLQPAPLPPPQSTIALPPSADVTAFISAAQREILRKQQQGKAITAAAAAAMVRGGGGVSSLSIKSPPGISPPFPRPVVEDAAAEQRTASPPPLPPPPPPLKRMIMPNVVANGGGGDLENTDQDAEMEEDESNYKMVIKNGVLMKKQKQRRYRTERPYGCDHCSARFTLRSNMERHIKQQHPEHWASKPRGGRRNNAMAAPVLAPHLRPSSMDDAPLIGEDEAVAALEDQVRYWLTENSKGSAKTRCLGCVSLSKYAMSMKSSINAQVNGENGGDGTEVGVVDDDSEPGCGEDRDQTSALVIDSAETDPDALVTKAAAEECSNDLASVSRLINIDNPMKDFFGKKEGEDQERDGEGSIDFGKEEEGEEEEQGDPDGEGEKSAKKATSAYSAAPHKIPCPHCDRKFPWQSSLNRHILTHTGSKPYRYVTIG